VGGGEVGLSHRLYISQKLRGTIMHTVFENINNGFFFKCRKVSVLNVKSFFK